MENIYPAIANVNNEAMNYSVSVIASQGLAIAILLKNDNISNLIFTKLLATNFDIKTHKNSTLIYNLACYYATHENKTALFEAVKQARLRGKPAAQFMEDSDFKNYLSDKDFLAALR